MPLWLFTYGHFLGLAYDEVAFPFYHIAGALFAVAWPLVLGCCVQRCAPRRLFHLDNAIHPTCLLLTLTTATVSAYNVWQVWSLITWQLLVSTAMIPITGSLIGALATVIFRQKLSDVKAVALATGLQNTLLTTVILQTSYPAPDASLMNAAIVCLDFTSLAFMYVSYIAHLIVWATASKYRSLHDNVGLSGIYRTIAEKLVKSMIKAGEISLRNRNSRSESGNLQVVGLSCSTTPTSSDLGLAAREAASQGFSTMGIKSKIFSATFDTLRCSSNSLSGENLHSTSDLSSFSYYEPLSYQRMEDSADADKAVGPEPEADSMSGIDYEMMNCNHGDRNRNTPSSLTRVTAEFHCQSSADVTEESDVVTSEREFHSENSKSNETDTKTEYHFRL